MIDFFRWISGRNQKVLDRIHFTTIIIPRFPEKEKPASSISRKCRLFTLGCTAGWGKYQREALYIISPNGLYIINSEGVASHQAAGQYTLTRDEIQKRRAAFDDIHAYGVMIYQACGLDKKILFAVRTEFFGGATQI